MAANPVSNTCQILTFYALAKWATRWEINSSLSPVYFGRRMATFPIRLTASASQNRVRTLL
jgi:hypothetical protein